MVFNINFNNLNFETQQDILDFVKDSLLDNFEQEAKQKNKTLEKLMWEDYSLDFELSEEEKKKYFKVSLNDFLEEKAMERINKAFENLLINVETYEK